MEKIKMTTPLVEMDGDEMTRIIWQMVKDELLLPYIDLKTEYFFVNELDGEVFAEDMGDFSYVWRNRYNREEHIHHYLLEFNVKSGLGKNRKDNASKKDTILDHKHLRLIKEHHRQRSFSAGDIKQAALNAGFNKANVYDAFTFRKPLKSSGRIYVVMRNED